MPDNKAPFPVEHYVPKLTRADADPSVQALGRGAAQRYPLVVIGRSRPPTASRFTLSRALWHCIWDDSPTFMVTSAHTYPQRVERAFAAELLAPADGIASLLESPPDVATQDELEQIAKHFRVSSLVIDHQVRNRLLAAP
jgi:Zn-dependent peptidase ImmA (M78 family)